LFGAFAILALSAAITVHQLSFWKDSLTLNTHAIEVTKDNPVAQSNLGFFWLKKGDYQKVVEHLSVVLTLCPGDAQDHFRIAYAYWRLGRFDKALIHYDLAIRFKPDNADYYFQKGLLLARLGRHAEAVEAFQMVLRLNPGHARAKQSLLQEQQNK
jgi:protein O-mannosyl-transferase